MERFRESLDCELLAALGRHIGIYGYENHSDAVPSPIPIASTDCH